MCTWSVTNSPPLGIRVNCARAMGCAVSFRAGRPQREAAHLAGRDLDVADQAHRAVPLLFKLAPFHFARLPWLRGGDAVARLNARHLVAPDDVRAHGMQQRGIGVDRADGFDLLGEGLRVVSFGLGVEPGAAAMRLEIGRSLRSAP